MDSGLSQPRAEPRVTQKEWDLDGIPVLFSSVSMPHPLPAADTAHQRRIRRFYELQARSYLRYCERWLYPQAAAACRAALDISAPLPQFRGELTCHITYTGGRFWSLYTQSREIRGEEIFLTRRGDTWDLSTGYPAELGCFFPPHTRWRAQLLSCAAAEIRRQERLGVSAYRPDWHKLLRRRLNPRNFYLTPEGIAFFYPMYAIAPAQAGLPTFLFPCDIPTGKKGPGAKAPGPDEP